MMRLLLRLLFGYLILEVVASGTASAEECAGAITAEEALRAEDARYAAQIANDFAAMERMFGQDLVYIRSVDGASADKRAYIEWLRDVSTIVWRARIHRSATCTAKPGQGQGGVVASVRVKESRNSPGLPSSE